MPAASRVDAFPSIMQSGIVLLGKGCPATTPAGGTPPGQFAPRFTTFAGAVMIFEWPLGRVVGITAPVPTPLASGYSLARGTVWFVNPPCTMLRHSML